MTDLVRRHRRQHQEAHAGTEYLQGSTEAGSWRSPIKRTNHSRILLDLWYPGIEILTYKKSLYQSSVSRLSTRSFGLLMRVIGLGRITQQGCVCSVSYISSCAIALTQETSSALSSSTCRWNISLSGRTKNRRLPPLQTASITHWKLGISIEVSGSWSNGFFSVTRLPASLWSDEAVLMIVPRLNLY